MTEPYSRIDLTNEQYNALNLNSVVIRLIKRKFLRELQQGRSVCKFELSVGQKTNPRSVTALSIDCKVVPLTEYDVLSHIVYNLQQY